MGHGADLSQREQTILRLRFRSGRRAVAIQRELGITELTYRDDLERALEHLAARLTHESCDGRRGMMVALAAGVADPPPDVTRRHLATCAACRDWSQALESAARHAGEAVASPVRRPEARRRVLRRAGALAGCVVAAAVGGGVSYSMASPTSGGDELSSAPHSNGDITVASDRRPVRARRALSELEPEGRRSARTPTRPTPRTDEFTLETDPSPAPPPSSTDEFNLETDPSPAPPPSSTDEFNLETQPGTAAPPPATQEEREFGLEGPGG